MNTTNIGTLVEISAANGYYLTQSYPTNFHTFVSKKILVNGDTQDNYKEVTLNQKTQLEEADAKWTEPSKEFIDMWNTACGTFGQYNESTGYFELNGINDIGYDDALKIYQVSQPTFRASGVNYWHTYPRVRTFIPIKTGGANDTLNLSYCRELEIYRVVSGYGETATYTTVNFGQCEKIRQILGVISLTGAGTLLFNSCYKLESVMIKKLIKSFSVSRSPLLSLESFQFMVTNAINTTAITITVHPDVYAKLTGDTTNAAAAALTPEEATQWQQLVTDAVAKNISFITA